MNDSGLGCHRCHKLLAKRKIKNERHGRHVSPQVRGNGNYRYLRQSRVVKASEKQTEHCNFFLETESKVRFRSQRDGGRRHLAARENNNNVVHSESLQSVIVYLFQRR